MRTSPVHYIAPSSISITPNANGSANDLAVYVARSARIKVYSRGSLQTQDATYQQWKLSGRNRRLAESNVPYTIYARLPKGDKDSGYLVFAPMQLTVSGWLDKYPYLTLDGMATGTAGRDTGGNWYVRLGEVSLPENGSRTVTLDTGILGTDQFNTEWNLDPDDAPLRVSVRCSIDGEDAGQTPYVPWNRRLLLQATLVEGWETGASARLDHWTISRNTGDDALDPGWPDEERRRTFAETGEIELSHFRGLDDDFNQAVSASYLVTAWGTTEDDPEGEVVAIAYTTVTIMAETVEKYELEVSTSLVTYSQASSTYRPAGGVRVCIRATDQKSNVRKVTRGQLVIAGLQVSYSHQDEEDWTPLVFDNPVTDPAEAVIPTDAFSERKNVVIRLTNTSGMDLSVYIVAFVLESEDAAELYLSRLHDDEAHGLIGLLRGVWFGIRDWWIDSDGNANLANVTVNKLLKAYNAYINKVQSTNYTGEGLLDTGWRITNDYQGGNASAVFDYLTIRKKAFFNELEIRKLSSIGGNFCLSPASGKIYRIEWYDGGGELLGYDHYDIPWTLGGRLLGLFSKSLQQRFLGKRRRLARKLTDEELVRMRRIRCYMFTDDGTTATMLNWTVGAQARCQTFNIETQTDHVSGGETDNDDVGFYDKDQYGGVDFYRGHKVQNTYWWRLVTGVGKGRLEDGKEHYYVEFMVNTGSDATHQDYGSDLPSVGDEFVQFGHRTRPDLQSVQVFETASQEAPCIKFYDGINSWNLNGKLVTRLSPKGNKFVSSKFEWLTAYGEQGVTVIRGLWVAVPRDANGNRRCYYNDVVSHNGSYWRCIVASGTHKEDAAMTHWYTQEEIDAMSLEEQMRLVDVENYTVLEPGDATLEQRAVWQMEVSVGVAPYLKISPAMFGVPCDSASAATAAYSVSASVRLMVTNLEASITSVSMEGADANVKLQGGYVTVNFQKGAAVVNKDYLVTVSGTLNGQSYTATDKVSVYAVIKGNDAYEVSAMPVNWLWNQTGANFSYEDFIRMIDEGISPSDFGIEIDKVEVLPDGNLGNSCAQLSVTNGGVAQPFEILGVTTSDGHVTAQYNNVTGRVWVTAVPNTMESGFVDVTLRYGAGVVRTYRIPFWCNLIGTWRELIIGDTRTAIAEKTKYLDDQYTAFHAEYQQSSEAATQKFNKITGIIGSNGEKIVTKTEFGTYKQSASENFAKLQKDVNGKLNTSEFKQTADSFDLCTTTQASGYAGTAESNAKGAAQGYANTAESNAKGAAQGYANTAESNAKNHANTVGGNIRSDLLKTGINIDGNARTITLRGDKVTFTNAAGTVSDKVSIDPTTATLNAVNAKLSGQLLIQQGSSDGLKLDSNGNILRYNTHIGWVPFYGSRCVRYISSGTYLDSADDYIIAGNGTYNVYLPNNPSNGKIITVKNLRDGILIYAQGSDKIVLNDEYTTVTYKDLDNYDRAELVYYNYRWYWNYLET